MLGACGNRISLIMHKVASPQELRRIACCFPPSFTSLAVNYCFAYSTYVRLPIAFDLVKLSQRSIILVANVVGYWLLWVLALQLEWQHELNELNGEAQAPKLTKDKDGTGHIAHKEIKWIAKWSWIHEITLLWLLCSVGVSLRGKFYVTWLDCEWVVISDIISY